MFSIISGQLKSCRSFSIIFLLYSITSYGKTWTSFLINPIKDTVDHWKSLSDKKREKSYWTLLLLSVCIRLVQVLHCWNLPFDIGIFLNKCGYVINILMHISFFMFSASKLLLAIYFTCVLVMKMMLNRSKFEQYSYSSSKCVRKHPRQLAKSTTHLAQKPLMNV